MTSLNASKSNLAVPAEDLVRFDSILDKSGEKQSQLLRLVRKFVVDDKATSAKLAGLRKAKVHMARSSHRLIAHLGGQATGPGRGQSAHWRAGATGQHVAVVRLLNWDSWKRLFLSVPRAYAFSRTLQIV